MAIARIATQSASATGTTSASATYPAVTTAGNLLIAVVTSNAGAQSTPTGWSVGEFDIGQNIVVVELFYKVATGSETSVSSADASASIMSIFITEYNGFTGTPTLDVSARGGSNVAALTVSTGTTATTTSANELAFAAAYIRSATTFSSWSNTFVNLTKVDQTYTAEKILAATGTQTTTLTTTGTAGTTGALIATFKGVTATAKPLLMTMGVGS